MMAGSCGTAGKGFHAFGLPDGVPPPPGMGMDMHGKTGEGEAAFSDFMSAFRSEMKEARDQGTRMQKFVPSKQIADRKRRDAEQKAEAIFGLGADSMAGGGMAIQEDFDEWPDEFLLLGVAEDNAEARSSQSPDTDTSTTSETGSGSTDETEETEDDEEDAWPIEMLVG